MKQSVVKDQRNDAGSLSMKEKEKIMTEGKKELLPEKRDLETSTRNNYL